MTRFLGYAVAAGEGSLLPFYSHIPIRLNTSMIRTLNFKPLTIRLTMRDTESVVFLGLVRALRCIT